MTSSIAKYVDKDIKIIESFETLLRHEHEKNERRIGRCGAIAKKRLTRTEFGDFLESCDGAQTHGWRITKIRPTAKRSQDYNHAQVFVHQYVNGGYSGDEYAGEIWVRISLRHYIHFHYRM